MFFSLLLAGFIGIQYSWVSSMQKDKLQDFKTRVISCINGVCEKMPFAAPLNDLADSAFTDILRRSFLSKGLGNVRFEYALALRDLELVSAGFYQKQTDSLNNLVLQYELRRTGDQHASDEKVTVVVPSWKKRALSEMRWIIFSSVLLTLMIAALFGSASLITWRRQHTLSDSRSKVIQNMMEQMEAPLTTVSVAAEALRDAKVMHDPRKVNYYQQIITEESKRMNEQVENFLREIKK